MEIEITRPRGAAIAPDGTLTAIGGNDANLVVQIGPDGERMPRPEWFPYTPSWAVAQLAHQLVVLTGEPRRRILRDGLELATFDGQDRFRPVRLAGSDAGVLVAWSQEHAWIRAKLPKKVKGRKNRTSRFDLPVPGRLPGIAIAREAGQVAVAGLVEGRLVVLDPVTGARLAEHTLPGPSATHVALSDDGAVAYAGHDALGWGRVWDNRTGERVEVSAVAEGHGTPAAFVDGALVLVGSRIKRVTLRSGAFESLGAREGGRAEWFTSRAPLGRMALVLDNSVVVVDLR